MIKVRVPCATRSRNMQQFSKMKLLQNKKFTGTAITLLLLLNAGLIVLFLVKPERPHGPEGGKDGPKNFIIKELQLNTEQQKQYELLVKEHRGQVNEIQEEIRLLRDSMVGCLQMENPDDSMVNVLSGKVGAKQEELDQVTFSHFIKLKAICNAEQKIRFGEIIHEVLRMMAPPRPDPKNPEQKR